jgi:hypothetical protein
MLLHMRGIAGMTQLNSDCALGMLFAGGGPDITYTGAIVPNVDQGILFLPWRFDYAFMADSLSTIVPSPLELRVPYYVVYKSGTTIRVSATKGGTPISFTTATTSDHRIAAITGWIVLSKSGTSVTIDCNSSGFSTWVAGPDQFASVASSEEYCNILRCAAKNAPEMFANNTQHFNDWLSLTGGSYTSEYPSNFLFSGLGSKHLGNRGYEGSIWSIQDDIYQSPISQQFASAKAFNS